jgi:hypothetical protein
VLALMIVARLKVFDNWDWPLSLILILGANSALAIFAAAVLRRSAEQARVRAVKHLKQRVLEVQKDDARAERLRGTVDEIESMREGAFASYASNPILGALILPSGASIIAMIEVFARWG